ncbi:hypothetical protein ACFW7J_33795 [Streptomyces sp. NPDC059525]|uniref:hypothetical protein n=1 Tax=Streptomyces sp. NPDC059525 TaxID=3346857 RepID=UPI0036911E27
MRQQESPEAVELLERLRRLRAARGRPTLERISRSTGRVVSTTTLSRLFSGTMLPSASVVEATVEALVANTSTPEREEAAVREVMALYRRAYDAQGGPRPGRRPSIGPGPEGRLQEELWSLIRSRGFTLDHLASQLHFSKSRVSEMLRQPHRLTPDLVGHLARVFEMPPEPLLRAVELAAQAHRAAEAAGPYEEASPPPAAPPGAGPAPDAAEGGDAQDVAEPGSPALAEENHRLRAELRCLYDAEARARAIAEDLAKRLEREREVTQAAQRAAVAAKDRTALLAKEVERAEEEMWRARVQAVTEKEARVEAEKLADALLDALHAHVTYRGPEDGVPAPEDAFIRAVAGWLPGDIVTVVSGLRDKGRAAFAARIVEEAVATRSVPDVTALALALLDAGPAPAAEGTAPADGS